MPREEAVDDDDYVASLLKRDAEANKSRYVASGLGSLLGGRPRAKDAPKPNTRFLRNIIRETDSHNAALKAREEEESRQRLRDLKREGRHGKRRREDGGDEEVEKRRKGNEREGRWASALGGLGKRSDRKRTENQQTEREEQDRRDDESSRHMERRRRDRSAEHRHERDSHRSDKRRHRKTSRSASPDHRRRRRRRSLDREGDEDDGSQLPSSPASHGRLRESVKAERSRQHRPSDREGYASDSDPLEAIIGPAPPPKVRLRGRGATSSSAGMDARFKANYDPKADVALNEDEQDDWDMALEALRDRAKWRTQGADRLRAAGFTDEEVAKWQKGGTEKDVEDVKWSKKGHGREWDRGKVADSEGEVDLKAEWAR